MNKKVYDMLTDDERMKYIDLADKRESIYSNLCTVQSRLIDTLYGEIDCLKHIDRIRKRENMANEDLYKFMDTMCDKHNLEAFE